MQPGNNKRGLRVIICLPLWLLFFFTFWHQQVYGVPFEPEGNLKRGQQSYIEGPYGGACIGQVEYYYIVTNLTDCASYNWTVTEAGTIVENGGSYVGIVWQNTGGTVSVELSGCRLDGQPYIDFATYEAHAYHPPNVVISPSASTICKGQSITLTASGAEYFIWSGGGISRNSTSITVSPTVTTTYTVGGFVGSSCSDYKTVTVTVREPLEPPVVAGGSREGAGNVTMTISSPMPDATYRWYASTATGAMGALLHTGTSYTVFLTENKKYFVTAQQGDCVSPARQYEAVIYYGLGEQGINYMAATMVLEKGVTDPAQIKHLPEQQVRRSIVYGDGLGRNVQTVVQKASPDFKDIVQIAVFDESGQQARSYLPFSIGSDGRYKTDGETQQTTFYSTSNPENPEIAKDARPYTEAVIEKSPLMRLESQRAPGQAWLGRETTVASFTNSVNEVRRWTVSGDGSQFYAGGELHGQKVVNPQGNEVRVFTDKLGRTVLQQQQLEEVVDGQNVVWLETYYVYDEVGNLRYQIPPQAIVEMKKSGLWQLTSDLLNKWCFVYNYDAFGRLATKKVPGTGELAVVYDDADRVVLTQDANQAATDKWMYLQYDNVGRVVAQGLYSPGQKLTQGQMQEQVDAYIRETGPLHVKPIPAIEEGTKQGVNIVSSFHEGEPAYRASQSITLLPGFAVSSSNGSFVASIGVVGNPDSYVFMGNKEASEVLIINYYDNYDFDAAQQEAYAFNNSGMPEAKRVNRVKGLLTGRKVRVLGTDQWLPQVLYYDEVGRPVQTVMGNYLNGTDRRTVSRDFEGKVSATLSQHSASGQITNVRNIYKYDHAGRLEEVRQQNNADTEVILGQYSYNAIGQLIEKNLHKEVSMPGDFLQSVDLRYDLQGRLLSINGSELSIANGNENDVTADLFGMDLLYEQEDNGLGNTGRWDGLVTGVKWKTKDPSLDPNAQGTAQRERGYRMEYDRIGRMNHAYYSARESGAWGAEAGGYDEKNIAYDANGNIRSLTRNTLPTNGSVAVMDNLSFSYSGNQLQQVQESGDQAQGFSGQHSQYSYDSNGNQTLDQHRGMMLHYNALNKIAEISKGTDKADYVYDAAGNLLARTIQVAGNTVTTTYANGFVYENRNNTGQVLAYFPTAEGRMVNRAGKLHYEYFLKDHQGNVRMAFSPGEHTGDDLSMELMMAFQEEEQFSNVAETRHVDVRHAYDGQASARLNARQGRPIGPRKWLTVQAGDSVYAQVQAHYVREAHPRSFVFSMLGFLANSVTMQAGGEKTAATQKKNGIISYLGLGTGLALAPAVQHKRQKGVPKAYLRVMVYDKDSSFVRSFEQPLTAAARGGWEQLELGYRAEEAGHLEVLVVNEEGEDVYFDAMRVGTLTPIVTQEAHFYPFGHRLSGMAVGTPEHVERPNRHLYNGGSEFEEFAQAYSTPYRQYDPLLGRFRGSDPLADSYGAWSPYMYGYNSPMSFNDPWGLSPDDHGHSEEFKKWLEKQMEDMWRSAYGGTIWMDGRTHTFGSGGEALSAGADYVSQHDAWQYTAYGSEEGAWVAWMGGSAEFLTENPNPRRLNNVVTVTGRRQDNSVDKAAGTLVGGWTLAGVEPTPYGEILMGVATTLAIAYYGPELTDKLAKELDNLAKKASGPQGVVYALVAKQDGEYNVYTSGYSLPTSTTSLKKGQIWKYGETTSHERYDAAYLRSEGVDMVILKPGNQVEIKMMEKLLIYGHFMTNGSLPAGNKIFR